METDKEYERRNKEFETMIRKQAWLELEREDLIEKCRNGEMRPTEKLLVEAQKMYSILTLGSGIKLKRR